VDIVKEMGGEVPIFGVCLGLQAIGVAYGGVVGARTSCCTEDQQVFHEGAGVLAGLPSPFTATRYHSLAIAQDTVPDELQVTAWTEAGVIMAARHRDLPSRACSSTRVGADRGRPPDARQLAGHLRRPRRGRPLRRLAPVVS
jgi:anthranilate/para-aminobenzoate synthase component II